MSEPSRPLRPGRGSRPSPASLGIVKVDADFEDEYPGGDTTCPEAYASLCRTGEALLGELDRRIAATFGISQAAATALAVIDGAGTPLTPSQVADRVLTASATMTATLDLLERRGWIRRVPNPADRRSVLIEITPEGRATTDQLLPGIRAVEQGILSALTHDEREYLLDLLAKILTRTAEVAAEPPEPLHGQRNRPGRLTPGKTPSPVPGQPPAPLQPHPKDAAEERPEIPSHTARPRGHPGPRCA
jgi:DNA-binding MarR family transcriptional regulator